jgi:hypothetical protein
MSNKHIKLWNILLKQDVSLFEKRCKYLLMEFGTTNRCNRFDIGNCIEFFISDWIKSSDIKTENTPNALRTDICIKNYGNISIKYSSSGDIKLHNSLGKNKDMNMVKTLIVTPNKMYFISSELLNQIDIDIKKYLKDVKDGLCLKRSLLTLLNNKSYFYRKDIDISIEKNKCKHRICAQIIYKYVCEKIK